MSIPGWYPDPAGQPNRFRYWFGEQWSEVTTDNPYLPPPPPPGAVPPEQPEQPEQRDQPEQPEQPDQPDQPEQLAQPEQPAPAWGLGGDWTPMSDAPAGSDGARGKGLLVAVIAVVLALLLVGGIVGGWLLTRGGDDGDRSAPRSEETPGETSDEPTQGDAAPSSCPPGSPLGPNRIRAGRVVGGGLSFAAPRGYRPASEGNKLGFEWLHDLSGVERVTETSPDQTYGWVSMLVAGALEKEDGWTSPEQAALGLAGCMASSPNMYRSHVSDRQLGSKATEVDGQDAWEVRHEVRVDDDVIRTEGDHVVVVVVDLGDDEGRYAVFTAFVPLGDQVLMESLDRAVRTLRVE